MKKRTHEATRPTKRHLDAEGMAYCGESTRLRFNTTSVVKLETNIARVSCGRCLALLGRKL